MDATEEMPALVVLCMNDYPLGVYSTLEKADAAALADWRRRERNWEAQGLTLGMSLSTSSVKPYKYMRYFYRQYEYVVDAAPR